jgi:hypothetical protein
LGKASRTAQGRNPRHRQIGEVISRTTMSISEKTRWQGWQQA